MNFLRKKKATKQLRTHISRLSFNADSKYVVNFDSSLIRSTEISRIRSTIEKVISFFPLRPKREQLGYPYPRDSWVTL